MMGYIPPSPCIKEERDEDFHDRNYPRSLYCFDDLSRG
jgi:hypothetical protein